MLQPKLLSVFGALSIGMIALVGGAGPSKADILNFGQVVPTNFSATGPNACSHSDGDPGYVCGATLIYVSGNISGSAGASPMAPPPGGAFLTLKPETPGVFPTPPTRPAANTSGESGLGEQPSNMGPPSPCNDPDCEILPPASVSFVNDVLGATLTDAVIGSVQSGETFQFFTEASNGAPFIPFGPVVGSGCAALNFAPGPDSTCIVNAFSAHAVAVQDITGNVLLVAVSSTPSTPMPEPASLMLLGTALLGLGGLGVVRRRKA